VFCDTLIIASAWRWHRERWFSGGAVKRQVKVGWKTRAYDLWRQCSLKRLHEWNRKTQLLAPGEAELVGHAAIAREFRLKGFRLTSLQETWNRAVDQGFV
jgi:hypothetical protein